MRFNLISNIGNGVGLEQDYKMLRAELEARGHQVTGIQFNAGLVTTQADVNIFLEVVEPGFFPLAPKQWVVPNPEWWFRGWDVLLPRFEKVLAKTRDCMKVFAKARGLEFLGWKSRDLMDSAVPRKRKFLHVAGKSQTKNTDAVIGAWSRHNPPSAELVIISDWFRFARPTKNVSVIKRATESELKHLMNECLFHLMPSGYEGWGHVLHEAAGVGAVILTTGMPPMNEVRPCIEIPPWQKLGHNAVMLHRVQHREVAKACHKALNLGDGNILDYQRLAREGFEAETAEFDTRLDALVGRA